MRNPKIWRLILDRPGDAAWNMASDEAISEACRMRQSPPTLRFYTWKQPAVTIGYFQEAEKQINFAACGEKAIPVVRRVTGGRAVLHGNDLSYSVCCGSPDTVLPDNLRESFMAIGRGFAEGLARLGLEVAYLTGPVTRAVRSPACFATTARHEMTCGGRKIMGSAQRRWRDGLLQQGSLLFRFDAEAYGKLFRLPKKVGRDRFIQEMRLGTAGLDELVRSPLGFDAVSDQISAGFEKTMGISLRPAGLSWYETERTNELVQSKYSKESWNRYRASP